MPSRLWCPSIELGKTLPTALVRQAKHAARLLYKPALWHRHEWANKGFDFSTFLWAPLSQILNCLTHLPRLAAGREHSPQTAEKRNQAIGAAGESHQDIH